MTPARRLKHPLPSLPWELNPQTAARLVLGPVILPAVYSIVRGSQVPCRQGYYAIINVYRVKGIAVKGSGTFVKRAVEPNGKKPFKIDEIIHTPLLIFIIYVTYVFYEFYEFLNNFCLQIIAITCTR